MILDPVRPSVISPILLGVLHPARASRLFAAGEKGVIYDPSDLSNTLFQNSAGTTPVTAANQPVGLMLDKSQGLMRGPELVTNGDFSGGTTTGWTPLGTGVALSVVSGRLRIDTPNANGVALQSVSTVAGRWYECLFYWAGTTSVGNTTVLAGGVNSVSLAPTTPPGVYRVIFLASASTSSIQLRVSGGGAYYAEYDNISVRELSGNHAFQTTASKRPVLEQDANGRYYLKGDATAGRAMVTNTLAPGTDKVQVFAGVRKISDAAQAVIAEYSAAIESNNGSFLLSAPNSAAANYNFSSKGTSQVDNTAATYAAARTDVLSSIADIAGDSNSIRVSGKQAALVSTNQGAGNYGDFPLYLFGRAGASLYFDGRLYGLIVRFGPNLNAVTIMEMERYMAGKTGIMF